MHNLLEISTAVEKSVQVLWMQQLVIMALISTTGETIVSHYGVSNTKTFDEMHCFGLIAFDVIDLWQVNYWEWKYFEEKEQWPQLMSK